MQRNLWKHLGVFCIGLSLVACRERNEEPPEIVSRYEAPQPAPPAPQELNYTVHVYDTMITDIKLRAGEEVAIQANGIVTFGKWYGSRGPDGGARGDAYAYDEDFSFGALLFKYGSSTWEEAGTYASFTSNESGFLEFRLNDSTAHDNSGSFTVKVSITR